MRLKSIKLAGFKSFVDPTTVPFPSNMTAVVGPNGCGKSNIIDAVRWVMGESSAKYLRGESMSDVIFNGSNSRKPVGQASIELVFDNSDGSAPGEYAAFTEISVKRRVTREGQSDYYMNGAKCRRRDITDLFLGTGLGPRSYAIIEQGMISRLIEAKPEELRNYIEEAAGISKYKERRRETENRMRRTLENIDRLTDLRDELERQLEHLERQAEAAEKYKTLKQQERQKQAEVAALRWRSQDQALAERREAINEAELELEKALSERVSLETELESLRQSHSERSEHFNQAQGRYYEAGAEIARVEQNLENQRERSRQSARELEQADQNRRDVVRELEQDEEKLTRISAEIEELEPQLAEWNERADSSSQRLSEAESRMSEWQQRWESFSQRSADDRQQAEVEQSRIKACEDTLLKLGERRRKLEEEQSLLASQTRDDELTTLREEESASEERCEQQEARQEDLESGLEGLRERIESLEITLNASREELQNVNGRLASQQALLEDQLGDNDSALREWLEARGWQDRPRLAERISVDNGWEKALESVLGRASQALAMAGEELTSAEISASPPGFAAVSEEAAPLDTRPGSLLAVTGNAGGAASLLVGVRTAETLEQALAERDGLEPGESLVTPQGVWLGRDWLMVPPGESDGTGVIERRKQVDTLSEQARTLSGQVDEEQSQLEQLREEREEYETELATVRQELADARQALSQVQSKLGARQARIEQIEVRVKGIGEELAELQEQESEESERLESARAVWQEAMDRMQDNADEKERLLAERDEVRQQLDRLRQDARHDRDHSHQLQLQVQTLKNQRDGLNQTLERMKMQREQLDERIAMLQESRESAEAPIQDLELELEGLLERRVLEEEKLGQARDGLEDIDRQVREREQARSQAEQRVQENRERLEKLRMDAQALELRAGQHLEQLESLELKLDDVLEQLPENASEQRWDEELTRIGNRIQRLGAINLAAIDEYRVQSERKTYLDEQNQDLQEALDTLESAIRKIDRETRNRFKETFDQINQGLQKLFPRVFGGGNAYLELTGEDLLETGVAIMARPPGKKNSTIHLLSGGEKALTAIALVFSIFQLNPAPFCMLDEVDAPLDDANVARYARMVKEMSEQVQFIYITHNKISMELCDHLMGVTMHEAGVSRLVSVDIEEAAALAEA